MLNLLAVGVFLAAPSPPVVDETFRLISPHHLVIDLPSEVEIVEDPTDWGVVSMDDANFGRVTAPEDITFVVRPGVPIRTDEGLSFPPKNQVILRFGERFQPGATYEIGWVSGEMAWDWTFEPSTAWTPSLKVNQAGYLPDQPLRYAYASYWTGYMPPMAPVGDDARVQVIDAESGESVLETRLSLRLAHDAETEDAYGDNFAQANVYEIDIFRLNPGWYYLLWEGVGRSWTFKVGDDAFDEAFHTVLRGLSSLRCGTPEEDGEPRWVPDSCQSGDVVLTNLDHYSAATVQQLIGMATEETRAISGGYHDGSGHVRDIRQLAVVDALVDLYELAPDRFARDDLGLPESGNGIPDVLDEAIWLLGFFAQLQEMPGGIRTGIARVSAADFSPFPPDQNDNPTWYAFAPSPFSSYRFAGAAAKVSRAVRQWNGQLATSWSERARRAWSWAESQRPPEDDPLWLNYVGTTGIASVDAYAAAELLDTTGDGAYDEAFKRYMPFDDDLELNIERFRRADEVIWPLMSYARARRTTAPVVDAALATLTTRVDQVFEGAQSTGYRFAKHTYDTVDSGTLATPEYAGFLFRMAELSDREELRTWGAFSTGVTLGTNPTGLVWVTGVGSRAVSHAAMPAVVRPDAPDTPAGIPVMGPCSQADVCVGEGLAFADALDRWEPAFEEWPPGESFVDSAMVRQTSGVSIAHGFAPTLYALGYMSRRGIGAMPEMMGGMGGMVGGGGMPEPGGEIGSGGAMVGTGGSMDTAGGMMVSGGEDGAGGEGDALGGNSGGATAPPPPVESEDDGCRASGGADVILWFWLILGLGGLGRRRETR